MLCGSRDGVGVAADGCGLAVVALATVPAASLAVGAVSASVSFPSLADGMRHLTYDVASGIL